MDLDAVLSYLSPDQRLALLKLKCRHCTVDNNVQVFVHPDNIRFTHARATRASSGVVWWNIEEFLQEASYGSNGRIALAQLGFTKRNPHGHPVTY